MKISILYSPFALFMFLFSACFSNGGDGGNWIIPKDQVFDGGPGKDGIPSIDSPEFGTIADNDIWAASDKIIAIKVGDEIRGYPHPILDWHEITNDEINGLPIALTYCPLTGTASAWKREFNGTKTTFGVSGLLYNANLMPYDRATDSRWSQLLLSSVEGKNVGLKIETYPVLETKWETFKALFPDAKVMTTNTGFSRNYERYPYGDYRTNNNNLLFPIAKDDDRLPRKERGLAVIINEKAKFYRFDSFAGGDLVVKEDVFESTDLVVFGSQNKNFMVAFNARMEDGTKLEFSVSGTDAGTVTDNEGNIWNLFGEAVSGPRAGTKLPSIDNLIGYWFSFGAFYPGLQIY
ncbi:MAG TPA: DUF3179 domain-containing protein [Bacteroidetes bacterium]|nr:DUF3179 domain-containing protein [Bacteroidota bacterium]